MAIIINGFRVTGTHGLVEEDPPELHRTVTYYWGLRGNTQIVSGGGGRPLRCEIWIHDRWTKYRKYSKAMQQLDSIVGSTGALKVEKTFTVPKYRLVNFRPQWTSEQRTRVVQTYDNVTFVGFERTPFQGRTDKGPLWDYGGLVDGGWIQSGVLHFYDLAVNDKPAKLK